VFAFARHTVTQGLLALGLTDADWSAFYRLFSRSRYDEERLSRCFFRETLLHSKSEEPYVTGIDTTQIPRSSMKMPGTGWLRAPRTAGFPAWDSSGATLSAWSLVTGDQDGYTRAMPLRFLPAFPEKAVKANVEPLKEWAAGLKFMPLGTPGVRQCRSVSPVVAGVGRWGLRHRRVMAGFAPAYGGGHPHGEEPPAARIAATLQRAWTASQVWGSGARSGCVAQATQGFPQDTGAGAWPLAAMPLSGLRTLCAGASCATGRCS